MKRKPIYDVIWIAFMLLSISALALLPLPAIVFSAGLLLLSVALLFFVGDRLLTCALEECFSSQRVLPRISRILLPHFSENLEKKSAAFDAQSQKLDNVIRRYEVLTENLAAAIAIYDSAGNLAYCSPYSEVLTGYSLDEIYGTGENFFTLVAHPEDKDLFLRAQQLNQIGESFQFRFRLRHKTGMEMWAESRTVPLFNSAGEYTSSLSVTLDVTRTVRYQQQVEETNRDLEDFTYLVSNNMKEPLFTIQGMNALLREELADQATFSPPEHPCHYISQAANQLTQLVDQVLEYARLSSTEPKLSRVVTETLLDEVLSDYERKLEKEQITIHKAPGIPLVLGEKNQLYRVFGNLLETYLRARKPGSRMEISISAQNPSDPKYVEIIFATNQGALRDEELASLFRPFARKDPSRFRKTGSGSATLASTKKIIEKLGGSLQTTTLSSHAPALNIQLRRAS